MEYNRFVLNDSKYSNTFILSNWSIVFVLYVPNKE